MNVIYIARKQYILNKAIESRLKNADINVLPLPEDIDEVYRHRHEADIFLFNANDDNVPQSLRLIKYLTELCRDGHKSFCLIGNENFMSNISGMPVAKLISQIYVTPVNLDKMVADMLALSATHDEFRRKKDILIVDDDNDFLMIVQRWLKNSYSVTGVRSGLEALQQLALGHFDLILLDYEMPEMDGYEVMGRIRQNPEMSNIPIIFLTGLNDRENVMRIIKHRPDGYILKSMKKPELLDTLERFFAESILGKGMF